MNRVSPCSLRSNVHGPTSAIELSSVQRLREASRPSVLCSPSCACDVSFGASRRGSGKLPTVRVCSGPRLGAVWSGVSGSRRLGQRACTGNHPVSSAQSIRPSGVPVRTKFPLRQLRLLITAVERNRAFRARWSGR